MNYFDPFGTREEWEKATIVFDTSALCTLYDLRDKYKQMMIEILDKMRSRIWLPSVVLEEYSSNRVKAITNPIREKYQEVDFIKKDKLLSPIKEFIDLQNNEEYFHPFMDSGKLEKLRSLYKQMQEKYESIKSIIVEQQDKRKDEILKLKENDVIKDFVDKLNHGNQMSYSKLLEIAKDGDWRYRNQIPPGYQDSFRYTNCKRNKGKTGIRQYNDLFIWKQILQYASSKKNSVIFITDDVKEDWYEPHLFREEPKSPREELILEFKDSVGKSFWIYTFHQFLAKLIQLYKMPGCLAIYSDLEEVALAIERLAIEKQKSDCFILRCENCKKLLNVYASDLSFNWQCNLLEERNMGFERQWIDTEYISCNKCGHCIIITIQIWEYPEGILNYKQIECNGAEMLKELDVDQYLPFINQDYFDNEDICQKCGVYTSDLDEHGLCPGCHQEYEQIMNEDD